jgi:hypothetical protein
MPDATTAGLLESVDRLAHSGELVSHTAMARVLESVKGNVPVADLNKVVDFALTQLARWQVEWLFSPARTPNVHAQAESKEWERLWEALLKALTKQLPDVDQPLRQKKALVILHAQMARRLGDDGNAFAAAMSYVGHALNHVGLRSASVWFMKKALYPSNSVGRGSG